MAARTKWGTRLIIGGGVAIAVGLLLRVSIHFPRIGAGSGAANTGGKKRPCDPIWVREDGPYFVDSNPVTLSQIVDSCSSAVVRATGLAKYGDLDALENALLVNGIPYQTT
jgi:hypothetical protein